jgi:hypothetical protein
MSAPMRPDRLAERAAPKGEPTPEPSIRAIGPAPERATRGESRASAPRPAGDVADEGELKAELGAIIDQLELSELQKRCLRARWLDAVTWMDAKAKQTQSLYYALRLVTIIGGLIIPALVSLDLGSDRAGGLVRGMTFGLSLLVAISAAVEGFFRYGERWRHYRRTAELLKTEGWQFFQLTGHYRRHTHASAYQLFASRIEDILQQDIDAYITTVAAEPVDKQPNKPQGPGPA